jgi:hypothetical protein
MYILGLSNDALLTVQITQSQAKTDKMLRNELVRTGEVVVVYNEVKYQHGDHAKVRVGTMLAPFTEGS